jgi:hypothetical protein
MKSVNKFYRKSNQFFMAAILMGLIPLLTVSTVQAQAPNDDIVDATELTSFPFSEVIDNTGASTEIGEVSPCGGDYSFWYTFTPATSGNVEISASSDAADPRIGMYTGTTHPLDEEYCSGGDAIAQPVIAGTTYYVQITSADEGPIEITISSAQVTSGNFLYYFPIVFKN